MSRTTPPRDRTPAQRAGRAFLAASALGALNTANARRPPKEVPQLAALGFFPGWLTSELPLHALGWQVAATAAFARKGALRSGRGLAGLGLSLASWATLVKIHQQAMECGGLFDAALREGLGDELAAGRDPMAPDASVPLTRRELVTRPAAVTRIRGRYVAKGAQLSYGDAGRRNHLDVWRRADLPDDAHAPVLIQVHGGGWVIGNKDQQAMPLMAHMCERGWVCVSINYRLSPRATWPDHIVDVKRAIAWVKANIAEQGGDPDFVAITGGSAGGHLSSLAALSANEPAFQPGFEEADTSVVAAVPFYGVYDFTNRDGTGLAEAEPYLAKLVFKSKRSEDAETWDQASTMSWVRPDAPPFMIVHGENDTLVPVAQARAFAAMLRAESKSPVVYAELPGAQHAFEVFESPRAHEAVHAAGRFLAAIRARDHQHTDL